MKRGIMTLAALAAMLWSLPAAAQENTGTRAGESRIVERRGDPRPAGICQERSQPAHRPPDDGMDRRQYRAAERSDGALRGRRGRAERPHRQRLFGRSDLGVPMAGHGRCVRRAGRTRALSGRHRQPRLHLHPQRRAAHAPERIFPDRPQPAQRGGDLPVRTRFGRESRPSRTAPSN